ncbi:FAD-dependent monooxygenase [Nonomuraea sp. KM88]|uniref:FAD-dependent monooxygenase n=1 Tax=Nonomuraea sp. KM88 TaxID=3457427 RepID=UPI003FCEA091
MPTRFPSLLSTPQYNTERVLEERGRRLGARIERGAGVVGLSQDRDSVEVRLRSGEAVHVRYVVGTDGVRNAVRKALDLPYVGHSAIRSVMIADVKVTEAPERDLVVQICREGFSFFASFSDGWYR